MSRGGFTRERVQVVDVGGRVPPHNLDAEAAILAAILSDHRKLDLVVDTLQPGHFYSDANRRVFEGALELQRTGTPVDLQTIAAWLKDRDWLQAVGGVSYIARLIDSTPAVAHVEAYARIVADKAMLRRVGETLLLKSGEVYAGTVTDARGWVDELEGAIHDVVPVRASGGLTQIFDLVKSVCESIADEQSETGIATGFVDFDERTGGMHDGELLIVAARPGMGKTSFVMNVATNVAALEPKVAEDGHVLRPRLGVCVFSLEMPKDQLTLRMLCSEARVDVSSARKKKLDARAATNLLGTAAELAQLPLWIDDTPAITLSELRAKVRRHQREFTRTNDRGETTQRIGLVVIDYLQLMKGREGAQSREQEISEISRGLKQLAKELGVPVIALSQLNRAVETRSTKEKRPQLSDLRESGAIEQDSDVIIFIYRPAYYLPEGSAERQRLADYAEIIIAKQRNGPTGRVPVTFFEQFTRFENRSRDAWAPNEEAA